MGSDTMIRKKNPRRGMTESSSCDKTVQSKPPKDVLGLGTHLVRELGFENSVDTLGRWLSHHVAGLIAEAQNAATASTREEASSRATDVILKIWEHRAVLPGKANPLAHYKEALEALTELRGQQVAWAVPSRRPLQALAEAVEGRVSRLKMGLALLDATPPEKPKSLPNAVRRFLSKEERKVIERLTSYIFEGANPGNEAARATSVPERLRTLIDDTMRQLQQVRDELPGHSAVAQKKPVARNRIANSHVLVKDRSIRPQSRGKRRPSTRNRQGKAKGR
jgi:phosphoglycolate phosphatase-like HAD superfamily hydrolase